VEVQPREIENYVTSDGTIPFEEWLESLRDNQAKSKIDNRIRRVRLGNFGDCKSVGDGVYELRIDFVPGYRVYFGQFKLTVLLLYGGVKTTQTEDIITAKKYWSDYDRSEKSD
jgi:putative addiction module killer protein